MTLIKQLILPNVSPVADVVAGAPNLKPPPKPAELLAVLVAPPREKPVEAAVVVVVPKPPRLKPPVEPETNYSQMLFK